MNIKDKRVKAIYHYLTESCTNSDIEELITLLRDYVINGNFIDFEEDDTSLRGIIDNIHNEELLSKCIDYLMELWEKEKPEDIKNHFKLIGFTDNDLEHYDINESLSYSEEDSKLPWERY